VKRRTWARARLFTGLTALSASVGGIEVAAGHRTAAVFSAAAAALCASSAMRNARAARVDADRRDRRAPRR
jgi:hypothetical protein